MNYVGLAFVGEGSSDGAFLRPLLRRLVEQVCLDVSPATVAVGDVQVLRLQGEGSAAERMLPAALRAAFGTTRDDHALGLPPEPAEVERLADPKAAFADARRAAVGPRRRARRAEDSLTAVAERVSLDRLARVPAFRRLRSETEVALRAVLPPT